MVVFKKSFRTESSRSELELSVNNLKNLKTQIGVYHHHLNTMKSIQKLRCATYMSPSIPVEYFETLLHYLEFQLGLTTSLVYETRWDGPPKGRPDPFEQDDVDLAFVSCCSYLKYLDGDNKHVELLPVSSVHTHPKGECKPGYFCEVVAHSSAKERVKEFLDLRGCRWAVNNTESLSGNIVPLITLKQLGENASFFGFIFHSGSHVNSIQMLLDRKVDATCVDSTSLALYLDKHSEARNSIYRVASWGPLPSYPILINSRLPEDFKSKLKSALLTAHEDPVWGPKLKQFQVTKFSETSSENYDKLRDMLEVKRTCSLSTVYY